MDGENRKRGRVVDVDDDDDELDDDDEAVNAAIKHVPKKLMRARKQPTNANLRKKLEKPSNGAESGKPSEPGGETEQDDDLVEISGDSAPDKAKVSALLELLSEEQRTRYEFSRRSRLKLSTVQELMKQVAGPRTFNSTSVMVMAGIAKVYVGEIIETARQAQDEWVDPFGPLRPRHLREAHRRLSLTHKVPGIKPATMFRG
eukprot:TRINITY_DN5721_c0_g1_i1.p1 TRINITY_DN5721_c0_g1~~TRINITY_DN5721_c0_g1_i1.p1  ORF type:complete len:202 (-),score=7.68 TRINITY_DN5721_c0_g1_i1:95-700(-)